MPKRTTRHQGKDGQSDSREKKTESGKRRKALANHETKVHSVTKRRGTPKIGDRLKDL